MQQDKQGIALRTLSQNKGVLVEGISSQFAGFLQRPKKPSPTLWRFLLVIGDTLLVLATLLGVIVYVPSLGRELRVIQYFPTSWGIQFTWVSIAFLSWNMARAITQVQDPTMALNRFKSPLGVLFALLTTCVLLFIFTPYFFSSTGSFSYDILPLCCLVLATPTSCATR